MKRLKGKNILIVDDEELLREILCDEFSAYGATVFSAENGRKAMELLKHQEMDVVITDMRMPGGDGLSLLKEMSESVGHHPKVFLCSGFSDMSDETAKSLGVVEIFPKPFSLKEMLRSVSNSLS